MFQAGNFLAAFLIFRRTISLDLHDGNEIFIHFFLKRFG